jgi:hypothetical protein
MRKFLLALATPLFLGLTLSACASVNRLGAANDVHALLVAIRDDDQQGFDAHVDRAALKTQLQAELDRRIGKNDQVRDLARLLGPSVVEMADQALIQPRTFRLAAEQFGYTPAVKIPNALAIAGALKPLPDGRVCATRKKDGPCVMTFTKEPGGWKLTSFDGDFSTLRLKL